MVRRPIYAILAGSGPTSHERHACWSQNPETSVILSDPVGVAVDQRRSVAAELILWIGLQPEKACALGT